MIGIVRERMARRLSPPIYILAALCFLLPFASASCNTERAKPLGDSVLRSLHAGASASTAQLDRCLDGLRGRSFVSYSGMDLAAGSDPSLNTERVSACPGPPAATGAAAARNENIGAQTLVAGALVATLLALLFGAVPFPRRGLVVAILSGIAIVMLALNENRMQTLVGERLAAQAQAQLGAGSPLLAAIGDPADLFTVTTGIGFWLAVILLGIGALYNSAATIIGDPSVSRPAAPPMPAGG